MWQIDHWNRYWFLNTFIQSLNKILDTLFYTLHCAVCCLDKGGATDLHVSGSLIRSLGVATFLVELKLGELDSDCCEVMLLLACENSSLSFWSNALTAVLLLVDPSALTDLPDYLMLKLLRNYEKSSTENFFSCPSLLDAFFSVDLLW